MKRRVFPIFFWLDQKKKECLKLKIFNKKKKKKKKIENKREHKKVNQ